MFILFYLFTSISGGGGGDNEIFSQTYYFTFMRKIVNLLIYSQFSMCNILSLFIVNTRLLFLISKSFIFSHDKNLQILIHIKNYVNILSEI